MSIFSEVINDMRGLYPDLKLDPSGKFATHSITTTHDLVLYEDKNPEDWETIEKETGNVVLAKDAKARPKLIIAEVADAFKKAQKRIEEGHKDPIENLKAGGFDISNETVIEGDVVQDTKEEDTEQEILSDEDKLAMLNEIMDGDMPPKRDVRKAESKKHTRAYQENTGYTTDIAPANLPAPVGVGGIVRPAVSAAEALAAWREFQELKHAILSRSDIKKIQGKDFVVKSGWRKFATFYNLTDMIVEENKEVIGNGDFLWKMKVVCTAPNGRQTEGVAICASTEKKFSHPEHDVYTTCHTRAKNRAISDMIAAGEISAEEMEA